MKKTNVAILVDNDMIEHWQASALEEAADVIDIRAVINCTNTRSSNRSLRRFVYHLIETFALRNTGVAKGPVNIEECAIHDFACEFEGESQKLPNDILQLLADKDVEVIVRFGMGLLEVDQSLGRISVLSFQHGDPSKYRGGPAGFYELLYCADKIGMVVQGHHPNPIADRIYALGYSKIHHDSYARTARTFYSMSRYLLRKAILNFQSTSSIDVPTAGRSYELPSNAIAILFLAKLLGRKARLLLYGAFVEKKWQVATFRYPRRLTARNVIARPSLDEVPISKGYTFYADPFFSADGQFIRLEALRSKTGLGDIVAINPGDTQSLDVILTGAHYSYPFSFTIDGAEFLLPEVASHSKPFVLNLSADAGRKLFLKGFGEMRLLDATLLKHNRKFYLFFGEADSAAHVLQLYCASDILDDFVRHPCSPIVIDPESARMGGRLLPDATGLIRFGQDNCFGYGARLNAFRVSILDEHHYEEEFIGSVEVDRTKGPHNIDVYGDRAVIDYYQERFSLLAGYRRILARLSSRKAGQSPAGQWGPRP